MSEAGQLENVAVLTSGGDAAGMNAAVRAVVRTTLHHGRDAYAVREGYRGMVAGGDQIRRMTSDDVGGILHRGGTVIGSARSQEFRTRDGRRRAARNLVARDIDGLVVIGGDGSLTGANIFRQEWPELLQELLDAGELEAGQVERHPNLRLVGLAASIDNDMFGTDMTIGADSALHRITEAVDAIHSTAASHQRSFVIEVMGRHCGYLALMGSLATAANWVLIPEQPPPAGQWEDAMCAALKAGRDSGRRQNLVMVAEGARDRSGNPITAEHVKATLETRLGEDTRVTILGHVQRGGSPSAFDRFMGTLVGHAAVEHLVGMAPDAEPVLVGFREHHVVSSPLMECVDKTREVAEHISAQDYGTATEMRGRGFEESFRTYRIMIQARPRPDAGGGTPLRLLMLHAGGPAPGMNTAARAAVRLGADGGHHVFAARNGFEGLRDGVVEELDWMDVSGWVSHGGAELGTSRYVPDGDALATIAARLREQRIDGVLMIGGWAGYEAAHALHVGRYGNPPLPVPIVCLPASINNDLPRSDVSVGADTALNSIVDDVDKIKQSAVASRRCYVVEVMGHDCGYLALLGGLATGAERVYLPEEGISLDDVRSDVDALAEGFRSGKRLGLIVRGEDADPAYTTSIVRTLFEREGGDLFDVRESVLGHIQLGGDPSPFDRNLATRFVTRGLEFLVEQARRDTPASAFVGLRAARMGFTDLGEFPALVELRAQRPREQPWMSLRPLARVMARSPER